MLYTHGNIWPHTFRDSLLVICLSDNRAEMHLGGTEPIMIVHKAHL